MKHLISRLSSLAFLMMLMCMSATVQAGIVHHGVCQPTLASRGFTRECWENTNTGKIYANAACTEELVGLDLAKAVTYAKLPDSPVTRTHQFSVAEYHYLDNIIDGVALNLGLNWPVSTKYEYEYELDKTTRYAQFTVKEYDATNARILWYRDNKYVAYGKFTVEISVNGTVVYNKNQDNEEQFEGVFVVSLPEMKVGDVVRFAVTKAAQGKWAGGPTFKASLEYNYASHTHEYPAGSVFCRICGDVKEHDHTYNETEKCSQCGAIDPTYTVMSGYVGKDNINDIKWELNKYNVLTFTGKGEMEFFNKDHNAWKNNYKDVITKVVIGEGITKINGESSIPVGDHNYFGGMARLTQVVLPSTLKSIGSGAFELCQKLSSITLPEGLETIGGYAFFVCNNLSTIVIPASVKTIGVCAFYRAENLHTITFNGAPTTIETRAFADLKGLSDFYLMSPNPVSVADDVFIINESNLRNATLHVNNNLYDWAKTTSPWNKFPTIVLLNAYNVEHTDAENNTNGKYFDKEASNNTWAFRDGGKKLVVKEDIPMQTLTYTRNFTAANQWQALCVPFEMQPSDWADKFDVAAISNFHEYTNQNGETEKVELEVRYVKAGKLLPNIPYLIRAKEAGEQTIVLNNVTLKATEARSISCSSTERRYTFTGTYDAIDNLKTKDYIFVSGGRLCKADNNTDMLEAMRWYLTIEDRESMTYTPSAALAKQINIRLIGEDEATGIVQIENGELNNENSLPTDIYNLNGMRLSKPQKGINIINGKKVLVK